jgi:hypothetical protein
MLTVEAEDHSPPGFQAEGGKLAERSQGFVRRRGRDVLCSRLGRVGIGPSDIRSGEYSKRFIVARRSLTLTFGGSARFGFCQNRPVKFMFAFPLITCSVLRAHGLKVDCGGHGCSTPLPHRLFLDQFVRKTIRDA